MSPEGSFTIEVEGVWYSTDELVYGNFFKEEEKTFPIFQKQVRAMHSYDFLVSKKHIRKVKVSEAKVWKNNRLRKLVVARGYHEVLLLDPTAQKRIRHYFAHTPAPRAPVLKSPPSLLLPSSHNPLCTFKITCRWPSGYKIHYTTLEALNLSELPSRPLLGFRNSLSPSPLLDLLLDTETREAVSIPLADFSFLKKTAVPPSSTNHNPTPQPSQTSQQALQPTFAALDCCASWFESQEALKEGYPCSLILISENIAYGLLKTRAKSLGIYSDEKWEKSLFRASLPNIYSRLPILAKEDTKIPKRISILEEDFDAPSMATKKRALSKVKKHLKYGNGSFFRLDAGIRAIELARRYEPLKEEDERDIARAVIFSQEADSE